jgi:ribose 5-phosphate isomerase B
MITQFFVFLLHKQLQMIQASFGIVLGGSGNGEQMAANKVKGVRAALVWSVETAKLAREHNNANVISIGGRMHDEAFCLQL